MSNAIFVQKIRYYYYYWYQYQSCCTGCSKRSVWWVEVCVGRPTVQYKSCVVGRQDQFSHTPHSLCLLSDELHHAPFNIMLPDSLIHISQYFNWLTIICVENPYVGVAILESG